MKNLHDDLLTQLRDRLRGYEENPDDQLWAAIQQGTKSPAAFDWMKLTSHSMLVASAIAVIFIASWSVNTSLINKTEAPKLQQSSVALPLHNQPKQRENIQSQIGTDNFKEPIPISKVDLINQNSNRAKIKTVASQSTMASLTEINQPIIISRDSTATSENFTAPFVSDNESITSAVLPDSLFTSQKKSVDSATTIAPTIIQPSKKIRRGINLTFSITPTLAFHGITPSQNDNIIISRVISPSILSTERLGFSGSIGVQGFVSKKIEYFASFSYYQQNHTVQYFYRHDLDNSVERIGNDLNFGVQPIEHAAEIQYNMKNIGAQLGFLYLLKEGKLSQKVGAGIDFQKGFQKQIQNELYDNANSTYLSYQLLYRNEYTLNPTIKLFVQPAFSYPIIINEKMSSPLQLKQYSVSLSVGIIYRTR